MLASYSKALQSSLSQSNSSTSSSIVGHSNISGNSTNIYHHKNQNSSHFHGGNGPRNVNLNSGNMRGIGKNGPQQNFSNRHIQVL